MASLQELLSRSVTQSLGLSDILAKKRKEAEQLRDVKMMEGDVYRAQAEADARVGVANAEGAAKLQIAKDDKRYRDERAGWNTALTAVGTVAGFIVGGPQGAAVGSSLGNAVSGGEGPGADISKGVNLFASFDQLNKDNAVKDQTMRLNEAKTLENYRDAGTATDGAIEYTNTQGKKMFLVPRTKTSEMMNILSKYDQVPAGTEGAIQQEMDGTTYWLKPKVQAGKDLAINTASEWTNFNKDFNIATKDTAGAVKYKVDPALGYGTEIYATRKPDASLSTKADKKAEDLLKTKQDEIDLQANTAVDQKLNKFSIPSTESWMQKNVKNKGDLKTSWSKWLTDQTVWANSMITEAQKDTSISKSARSTIIGKFNKYISDLNEFKAANKY